MRRSLELRKKHYKSALWISRSFKVIHIDTVKNSTMVLLTISSKSVSIYDRFHGKIVIIAKIADFEGVPNFRLRYGKVLEYCRSKLLNFAFNVKHFISKLSWFISSHFGAIHS